MSQSVVKWGLGLLLLMQSSPATGQTDEEIEDLFWRSVECESRRQVQAYFEVYPTGRYLAEAHACLEGQLDLERAERILVQQGLASLDYSPGPADGLFGGATRTAVRQWQRAKGEPVTGYLTRAQADALVAQGQEAVAEQRQEEEAQRQAQEAERRRAAEAERQVREAERQRQEEARQRPQPGEIFRDCPTCPDLVVVPAGTYRMGSPSYEGSRDDDEGPVHHVTIGQPFAVGVYEVTVEEYGRFVRATGYTTGDSCRTREKGEWEDRSGRNWRETGFRQTEENPVVCVNWRDARAYVEWLSDETGQGYRLLSEAEWEYVARAGTRTARYWGR